MTRPIRVALLAPLVAGCYAYRPLQGPAPAAGDRVRLTLTDSGAVNLAAHLGPATEQVSGRVIGDSGGAYLVSVLGTRRRGGTETEWRGEHVLVPRAFVAEAHSRRFSRRRTVIAAIGLIAVGAAAREAFWGPGGVFGGARSGGGGAPR